MEPILFNISVNDLDTVTEQNLSKFADDIKLERIANTLDGSATTQKNLDRLKKWFDKDLLKFKYSKWKVLHQGDQ